MHTFGHRYGRLVTALFQTHLKISGLPPVLIFLPYLLLLACVSFPFIESITRYTMQHNFLLKIQFN